MRCERIYERSNGSVVRLIAIGTFDVISGSFQSNIFVAIKIPGKDSETYIYPSTHQDKTLGGLSVDDYIKHGRKGLMSVVRPHEIFGMQTLLRDALEK